MPPLTLPSRDVSVLYRAEGSARDAVPGGLPGTVRVLWSAERQALLLEPQGRPQSLLVDLVRPSVMLVDAGVHSAMSLPVRPKDLDPVKLRDAHLRPVGHATVGGLACTEYEVRSKRGHGTLCLTDDGVALRGAGEVNGRPGSFTALEVDYGALPAAMFEVPAGYMSLAIPGLDRLR